MKNQVIVETALNIIRVAGGTPLFTIEEIERLPHVLAAHIEDDQVYVSSREIVPGTYGHPRYEVQAKLHEIRGWEYFFKGDRVILAPAEPLPGSKDLPFNIVKNPSFGVSL